MANDDFNIELGQSVRRHVEHRKSPLDDANSCAVPYDGPASDSTPVFIAESAMRAMERHASSEKDKEVGGVLLGGFYRTDDGGFVEITDIIQATSARGTDVSLTFTHETWEQINEEQARRSPDLRIVGWYHSHPALGVFMSKEDEFIHSSFFTEPWHVALVVDPIYHNWGCFNWKDGVLDRTAGFYVFGAKKAAKSTKEYVKSISAARQTTPRAASAGADRRGAFTGGKAATGPLWTAIVLLTVALAVVGYFALAGRSHQPEQPNYYRASIRLLSASDIGDGMHYLRQELITHPKNLAAYRELSRVIAVTSNPAVVGKNSDRLDATNLMLAMADKMARGKVEYESDSPFADLIPKKDDKPSLKLAADDPVKRALAIYEAALPSRSERLNRAIAVKKAVEKGAASYRTDDAWYDKAVTWLMEENLRRIAYGRPSGGSAYEAAYDKLSAKDKKTVARICAGLGKSSE